MKKLLLLSLLLLTGFADDPPSTMRCGSYVFSLTTGSQAEKAMCQELEDLSFAFEAVVADLDNVQRSARAKARRCKKK